MHRIRKLLIIYDMFVCLKCTWRIVRTRRIGFPHCTAVERLLFPWLARDADYVTPSTANSTRRRAVQQERK